jgi:hypothetical protein
MAQSDVFFTADEARSSRQREVTIHDEVRAIENAVFRSIKAGLYLDATVSDNTLMTDSSTFGPAAFTIPVDPGHHLWLPDGFPFNTGDMVVLQTTGILPSPLQPGVIYYVEYVDATHINLCYTYDYSIDQRPNFIKITDAGTGIHTLTQYLQSRDFFSVWQGQQPSDSRLTPAYSDRMNAVINYFTNLGYSINRIPNPATNNTFSWKISW